ncbi:MAG: class I SAM-dependent methyltransferase [Ignavibacteriales bacterium]
MLFKNAVQMSHMFVSQVVHPTDTVIDATCGNGHDTVFLAGLVREGKVLSFDIAEEAIEKTERLIAKNQLSDLVVIIHANHVDIPQFVTSPVKAIMFNLGYLPGSKTSITSAADSLQAVTSSLSLLASGGVMTIVFYTGHPGGREEADLIIDFVSGLPQQEFEVVKMKFLNQINDPPALLVVQKI